MLKQIYKLVVVFVIFLSPVFQAYANLVIAPMRVVFEDRARTESIVLINASKTQRTYRIEWSQKKALEQGGYQALTDEEMKNFPIASNMMRMSPRQVTLAPNQRQVIKVSLRRPRNLPDGEYRSHLTFRELPAKSKKAKSGIQLNMIMNFSMPIIVRQGNLQSTTKIDGFELTKSKKSGKTSMKVFMSHQGQKSTIGQIVTYFTPENSNQKVEVSRVNHFNFYPEIDNVVVNPTWFGKSTSQKGKLEIVYKGSKELEGKILAKQTFKFSPDLVKLIP